MTTSNARPRGRHWMAAAAAVTPAAAPEARQRAGGTWRWRHTVLRRRARRRHPVQRYPEGGASDTSATRGRLPTRDVRAASRHSSYHRAHRSRHSSLPLHAPAAFPPGPEALGPRARCAARSPRVVYAARGRPFQDHDRASLGLRRTRLRAIDRPCQSIPSIRLSATLYSGLIPRRLQSTPSAPLSAAGRCLQSPTPSPLAFDRATRDRLRRREPRI